MQQKKQTTSPFTNAKQCSLLVRKVPNENTSYSTDKVFDKNIKTQQNLPEWMHLMMVSHNSGSSILDQSQCLHTVCAPH